MEWIRSVLREGGRGGLAHHGGEASVVREGLGVGPAEKDLHFPPKSKKEVPAPTPSPSSPPLPVQGSDQDSLF